MSYKNTKKPLIHPALPWPLALCLALVLAGCAGKPLAEREVIRALFWQTTLNGCRVNLLLQNIVGQDGPPYIVRSAEALTPAKALRNVENALRGIPFYGAADLLVLPADADYDRALQMANATLDAAKPVAELETVLLGAGTPQKNREQLSELYDAITAMEKKQCLHTGVETLYSAGSGVLLPQYEKDGCRAVLLNSGYPNGFLGSGLESQLAMILAGKSSRLDCDFARAQAWVTANASVDFEPVKQAGGGVVMAHLMLRDMALHDEGGDREDEDPALQELFEEESQRAFAKLLKTAENTKSDPFHSDFWTANIDAAQPDAYRLILCFEYAP